MLAAVYYGKEKPDYHYLFEIVTKSLNECRVHFKGKSIRIKAVGLVADLPAKAACLNMMSFNSYSGCTVCKVIGTYNHEHRLMTFPVETPAAELRSVKQHKKDVKNRCNGVKGAAPVAGLIPVPTHAPFDAMHLVCLGLSKTLTLLCVNRRRISSRVADSVMQCAVVPKSFNRVPRSLNDLKHWKANEWKSYLLYYSVIIAAACADTNAASQGGDDTQEQLYILYSSLSCAVHLLSSSSVSPNDIAQAETLIKCFRTALQSLFGERSMTFSTHAVMHLPRQVEAFGPLWSHSAFTFESFFGKLMTFFSGVHNEGKLIARRFLRYHQSIAKKNAAGDGTHRFLDGVRISTEDFAKNRVSRVIVGNRVFASASGDSHPRADSKHQGKQSSAFAVTKSNAFVHIKELYIQNATVFAKVHEFRSTSAYAHLRKGRGEPFSTFNAVASQHFVLLQSGHDAEICCSSLDRHFISLPTRVIRNRHQHFGIVVCADQEHD
jgi:hypothetical protein